MRYGDAGNQGSFRTPAMKGRADSYWKAWVRDWCCANWVKELAVLLGLFDVDEDISSALVF